MVECTERRCIDISIRCARPDSKRSSTKKESRSRQIENFADVLDPAFHGIDAEPQGAESRVCASIRIFSVAAAQSCTQNPGCFWSVGSPQTKMTTGACTTIWAAGWVPAIRSRVARSRPPRNARGVHPLRMGCHGCFQQGPNGFLANGLVVVPADMESRGNSVHTICSPRCSFFPATPPPWSSETTGMRGRRAGFGFPGFKSAGTASSNRCSTLATDQFGPNRRKPVPQPAGRAIKLRDCRSI